MLIEIQCEKFRQKKIIFNSGLNVVLGDEVATNSIGKSTLLMVIDFIFGGESFLEHNSDVVDELGEHEYLFSLQFSSGPKYFKRGTFKPDLIYVCNEKYEESEEPISIDEYKMLLKKAYDLENIDMTFRSIVSLFSRVWGKENLDVKQPLHSHKNQKSSACIENLLKTYKKYETIRALSNDVKRKNEEKTAIKGAFDEKIISKISKSQYKERLNQISKIDSEISNIKQNLAKYAVNISEIVSRETLELKNKKDNLLSEKTNVSSRLNRVKADLSGNKHIKSKHFEKLVEFFPEVNSQRIADIEEFHSKISKILKNELRASEKELSATLGLIDEEIEAIDKQVVASLGKLDDPGAIIDRVHNLSKNYANTSTEIEHFETEDRIKQELKDAKEAFSVEKLRVLKLVEDLINDKTRKYVTEVYGEDRRSPNLSLKQNSYTFEAVEDTGTGKAYSNLILLDLTFLETTQVPFLIHDSVLFKNIENEAVSRMIDLYQGIGKQVFIAIDEVGKYGDKTKNTLHQNNVIELSNNSVLYIKDWRK